MRRIAFLAGALAAVAVLGDGCGGGSSDAGGADAAMPPLLPPDASQLDASDCVNLCLRQKECIDTTTFVSGIVRDPAGKLPVYGAIVYVPNAPVGPLPATGTCDRCGTVSGSPLVATLTGADGRFLLTNVPAGPNVPLVVQIGKWRRQLVIPNVTECAINPLDDIRLPRSRCEGDLPRLALTTGGEDAMECFLRKLGIDDSEFTTDTGPGAVHLYAGSGTTVTSAFDAAHGGQTFAPATSLWSDAAKLARYDTVLFACEGQTFPATKPPAALAAVAAYAKAGGRVLASHWQRYWFDTMTADPSGFAPFATWNDRADPPAGVAAAIDVTYTKGGALKQWLGLSEVGALDANGHLALATARHDVDAVDPARATAWASFANPNAGGQSAVALLSANVPTDAADAQQCGRVTYADFHASAGDAPGPAWPGGCTTTTLTDEEKALAFFLFDLDACLASEHGIPDPPNASTSPCATAGKCDTGSTDPVARQTAVAAGSCD